MIGYGFEIFHNESQCEQNELYKGVRYVVKNCPHKTLYGTNGRKEALIVGRVDQEGQLKSDQNNIVMAIVEAKWQNVSGSTDEKLPYVWESFLASPVPNWIVLYGGKFWQEDRGRLAIDWLKSRARELDPNGPKCLKVVNAEDFNHLARSVWGLMPNGNI